MLHEPTIYAIAIAVGLLAQIVLQVIAALKTEKVKQTLAKTNAVNEIKMDSLTHKVDSTQKTGEAVHLLVNSAMAAALKTAAVALRRIADDKKDDADIKAAESAEMALAEHIKKQKKVDDLH